MDIRTMSQHSPQAVFDFMVTKIMEQGKPSMRAYDGLCMYRSTDEEGVVLKCVVGHLIKNEDYAVDMERNNYAGVLRHVLGSTEAMPEPYRIIMLELQCAHDHAASAADAPVGDGKTFLEIFSASARDAAGKLKLSAEVIRAFKAQEPAEVA